jgi:hypothetical protein
LNPRKADLHRWRETFAERLRGLGIDAEATRQATRGETRHHEALWQLKAKEEGRLQASGTGARSVKRRTIGRDGAMEAWAHIMKALAASDITSDRQLAEDIRQFLVQSPYLKEVVRLDRQQRVASIERPDIERAARPAATNLRRDHEIER